MNSNGARLTVYFGERARGAGSPFAETAFECLTGHGVSDAILLRGGEGFGPRHGRQSSSRLSLSEDLPMVLAAVGEPAKIESAGRDMSLALDEGLITREDVKLLKGSCAEMNGTPASRGRIDVWIDRGARIDGTPAYKALPRMFRNHGSEAAVSLLGIDGLVSGERHRAGFFSANLGVPMLVSAVGQPGELGRVWETVRELLPEAFAESSVTVDPVDTAGSGRLKPGAMNRVAVFAGGIRPGGGLDGQRSLVRRLRRAGAAGATALQGVFGFSGAQVPHGESFRTLRRRIPVLTEFIDSPGRSGLWLAEVEAEGDPDWVAITQEVVRVSRPGDPV